MALVFNDIKDEFLELVNNDKLVMEFRAEAVAGVATYQDVSLYAARIGTLLGRTLKRYAPIVDISEWDVENLIPSALGLDHAIVAEMCVQVQSTMNEANGYGIRAVAPEFDSGRAYGLVDELKNNPEFYNIEEMFYDQLTNFSQNVVDESVRANAEMQSRAGIEAQVIRTAEPDACPWCLALEGTYDYSEVKDTGNEVWRRHDNCRCTVEYSNARGQKELVSSRTYNYRGQSQNPANRRSGKGRGSASRRIKNYDQGYHEFQFTQLRNIMEQRGWTHAQALGYYQKHEAFYKSVYYGD